ncbi:uncharacterized protein LOC125570089 isoform X2 [Nematostella vectensis]|nr:uncharacterized protein LOC125570089 isoform X2 [Nematostella vectensis]
MAKSEQQEIDLKAMKTCQLRAGRNGLLAIVIGGAVAFVGLRLAPGGLVKTMHVPVISLGCAALSGWIVSVATTKHCNLEKKSVSPSIPEGISVNTTIADTPNLSVRSKFGDEGFFQEEKR